MIRRLTFLIAAILLVGCGNTNGDQVMTENKFRKDGELQFVRPDGSVITSIDIEVVSDRKSQATGLMGRRSMPERTGMLFVYDAPKDQSFWMKNTPMPLDIIFIAEDSSVVNIARRTKPLSSETIESTAPAQFVLEVRGGFTERAGIDDSTKFRWTITSS